MEMMAKEILQKLNFVIQHPLSNENAVADFLSRLEGEPVQQGVLDDSLDAALLVLGT